MAAEEEIASDGTRLFVGSYPWAATYDGDGNLQTETMTTPSSATYTRTYTWVAGELTDRSQWIKDIIP
jgi:hypothetical protein